MRGAEGGTRAELKRRLGKLRKWLEELETRLREVKRRQGRVQRFMAYRIWFSGSREWC